MRAKGSARQFAWAFVPIRLLLLFVLGVLLPARVGSAAPSGTSPAPSAQAPGPATGSPTPALRAAELKASGDAAMQEQRYEAALEAYEEAALLEPNPALQYNRGRALQLLGRFAEALTLLERFERTAPAHIRAKVPQLGELLVEVRSRVSTLSVVCNVPGARVRWRERPIGVTPLAPSRLSAGAGDLEVVADGYVSFTERIELIGAQMRTVTVQLERMPTSGTLRVRTDPVGASLAVDGKPMGRGPAEADVPAGTHTIVAEADGYESVEMSAVVDAGETKTVDIQLAEAARLEEQWWLWTGIGVLVVGGIVITAVALTERSADSGDIAPGQVSAPLVGSQGRRSWRHPVPSRMGATLFEF